MRASIDRITLVVILTGILAISTAYGMLLLLPLYVKEGLGGNEADFGTISASATVTAAIAIGLLIRFPRAIPSHYILALTSACYGLAAFGVSLVHAVSWQLLALGVFLGTTWAMAYTTAPMVVSALTTDETRSRYIGYATGMVQVGFGLGPVVGSFLHHLGLGFGGIFRVAAVLAVLSAIVIAPTARRVPELAARRAVHSNAPPLGRSLLAILKSPAVVPLSMILLCACLFTTMNTFQTTFAAAAGLNFDVFYISYTLAVIFARFGLVRIIPDASSPRMLAMATSGIVAAVVLFLLIGGSDVIYALAAVLLGVSYGLTLPAAQALTVNLSAEQYRPRMLPIAGLLFQVAILSFPLVAGTIVAASDYTTMFWVLLAFALAIAALGMRRSMLGDRRPRAAAALVVGPAAPDG